jgi:glutaredoxin 3
MPPTENLTNAAAFVEDVIKTNKIVVFSMTTCPYCDRAKGLFHSLNETYYSLDLDKDGNTKN